MNLFHSYLIPFIFSSLLVILVVCVIALWNKAQKKGSSTTYAQRFFASLTIVLLATIVLIEYPVAADSNSLTDNPMEEDMDEIIFVNLKKDSPSPVPKQPTPSNTATQQLSKPKPLMTHTISPSSVQTSTDMSMGDDLLNPEPESVKEYKEPVITAPLYPAETDSLPSFPGGEQALNRYLNRGISGGLSLHSERPTGVIYVSFIVEKTGKLTKVKLNKGTNSIADQIAVEMLHLSPAWTPGYLNGKAQRVQCMLPIRLQP